MKPTLGDIGFFFSFGATELSGELSREGESRSDAKKKLSPTGFRACNQI